MFWSGYIPKITKLSRYVLMISDLLKKFERHLTIKHFSDNNKQQSTERFTAIIGKKCKCLLLIV